MRRLRRWMIALVTGLLLALAGAVPVSADAGPGDVVLSTVYTSVVTDKGQTLSFPLEVANRTQAYQEVRLEAGGGPAEWQPAFRDRGLVVRTVMLGPGRTQTVEFQLKAPAAARAGDYAFVLRALSESGRIVSELRLAVTLQDKVGGALKLSTQFPNLRGPAGTFGFKFDLTNDAAQDREVSLSAAAPKDWEVSIKPAFESKQVSSLRVKAGSAQGIDVEVTAPQKAGAAEYEIIVTAAAGADRADVPLRVLIVGTSRVALGTASGQLNAKATVDQDSTIELTAKNVGGAPLRALGLSSYAPDGWQVRFDPASVDGLDVDQQTSVRMTIRPSGRALAGDYLLSVTASAQGTSDSKDIRVTVETPTAWGWAAALAMAAVLGALGWLFAKLSRR